MSTQMFVYIYEYLQMCTNIKRSFNSLVHGFREQRQRNNLRRKRDSNYIQADTHCLYKNTHTYI